MYCEAHPRCSTLALFFKERIQFFFFLISKVPSDCPSNQHNSSCNTELISEITWRCDWLQWKETVSFTKPTADSLLTMFLDFPQVFIKCLTPNTFMIQWMISHSLIKSHIFWNFSRYGKRNDNKYNYFW